MSLNKKNLKGKSSCNVQNCKRNPNVSMHRIPQNSEIRKKWTEVLQLPSDIFGSFKVCGDHFVDADFRPGLLRQGLKHSAVPSVNLPSMEPTKLTTLVVNESSMKPSVNEKMYAVDGKLILNNNGSQSSARYETLFDDDEGEFILGL